VGLERVLLHVVKSYDMGPAALLPIRRKVCCGFLSPLKYIVLAGFELANHQGDSLKEERNWNITVCNNSSSIVKFGVGRRPVAARGLLVGKHFFITQWWMCVPPDFTVQELRISVAENSYELSFFQDSRFPKHGTNNLMTHMPCVFLEVLCS
jgi:hypothetical protein